MPESVRDRLNCRHELLFLLASTGAAPQINSVLAGIVHEIQIWLSGGKG